MEKKWKTVEALADRAELRSAHEAQATATSRRYRSLLHPASPNPRFSTDHGPHLLFDLSAPPHPFPAIAADYPYPCSRPSPRPKSLLIGLRPAAAQGFRLLAGLDSGARVWGGGGGMVPNGLLPNVAAGLTRRLDAERWAVAEERTAELIACIQPTPASEERRRVVADYVQRLIMGCLGCQV